MQKTDDSRGKEMLIPNALRTQDRDIRVLRLDMPVGVIKYPVLILSALMTFFASRLPSQIPSEIEVKRSHLETLRSSSAAASWRNSVVDPTKQEDSASPTLRKVRNEYWDTHLPLATGKSSRGTELADADDLLTERPSLWVVATFSSFKVFRPTLSGGAYTEMTLRIDTLLANRTDRLAAIGSSIDVDIVGGSIRDEHGADKHFNLQYDPYTFVPEHSYLLQLMYFPDGAFYRPERSWDLSAGVAIPVGTGEATRYLNGNSHISGQPIETAVANAREILRQAGVSDGRLSGVTN